MRKEILISCLMIGYLLSFPAIAGKISVNVYPCLVVKGQDCQISWNSVGPMADRVNISVWLGQTKVVEFLDIQNNMSPQTNSYNWPVPTDAAAGRYIFRITTVDSQVSGQAVHPLNEKRLAIVSTIPGSTLTKNSYLTISWHGFGLGVSVGVKIELFRNGSLTGLIGESDMSHSSGCGRTFNWKVGHLWNPGGTEPTVGTVAAGDGYKVRVTRGDGSYFDETETFSIGLIPISDWFKQFVHLIKVIEVVMIPAGSDPCQTCGVLQLEDLRLSLDEVGDDIQIVLFQGGQKVMVLGHAKGQDSLRSTQRIDFGKTYPLLENGGKDFELRFFDKSGKLLHTQSVVLKPRNL